MLAIHSNIKEKLNYFQSISKIPNIIFHGPSGSGKRTLVNEFIKNIYNNERSAIKSFVCFVNCAHGKGIKFIREELKFFAKTHINFNEGNTFKSIILSNADKLTTDAQSALRRCIELFSHNTRFFIIVEDKYKLLKPILSRFCEIYVPEPEVNGQIINLYKYNIEKTFQIKDTKLECLKRDLNKFGNQEKIILKDLFEYSEKLYQKGYSGKDVMDLLENKKFMENKLNMVQKLEFQMAFSKIRKEFRNEKIIILFILHFLFLSSELDLENISFI
jgi:DNA polymerase III delta prime subunit